MSCPTFEITSLADAADLAQVVIAAMSLLLAVYILFYQKRKDREVANSTALLNEQNIKLQWFKELIVQPNLSLIDSFYAKLTTLKDKISSNDLTIAQKEDLNEFAKIELAKIRKSLVDVLLQVNPEFADEIKTNLDGLIDGITDAIFNDELKLALPTVYEKHIGSKISYSRNTLIAQLFNYKGV